MTINTEARREGLISFSTQMKGLAVLTLSVLSGIGLEVRVAEAEESPATSAPILPPPTPITALLLAPLAAHVNW